MLNLIKKQINRYQCKHEFGVYNYTHVRCEKCGKKKKDEIMALDFIAKEWGKADESDSKENKLI